MVNNQKVEEEIENFFKKDPINEPIDIKNRDSETQRVSDSERNKLTEVTESLPVQELNNSETVTNTNLNESKEKGRLELVYNPPKNTSERGRPEPRNVELYPDQYKAIQDLKYFGAQLLGRKYTQRQIIIDAVDRFLKEEYKKFNE